MSGSITFSGIGTGTDMQAIVDQLVAAERYNINRLNTWKSDWENKITAIQGLNTRLSSYESTVNGMNTESEFMATTSSSNDEDVVSVSSGNTAYPGSYQVDVGAVWNYRKAVAIVNDTTSDFTGHLIHIDETQLDSSFWSNVQSDHSDLRFYQGDSQLDFHVQNWNYGGNTADIWVRTDSIDADGEEISMYYGNASASDASTANLVDLKKGWTEADGIKGGLWHFDDDVTDAGGNGNNGTVGGAPGYNAEDVSWVENDAGAPDFGKSLSLDGTSDYVQVATRFTIDSSNNKIDFKEDSGDELTATIDSGTWTISELETKIKTAMESAGTGTYTVTYDSSNQGFTISGAGITGLDLLWGSGSNAESNAAQTLGFDDEDDTGATSYISDGESVNNLDMTGGFTTSAWIKLDPADKSTSSILDRFNDGDDSRKVFSLGLDADGQVSFEMYDDTATRYTAGGSTDLADSAWHQIAVTVDNGNKEIKLYVDGSQAGSTVSFTGNILSSGDPLGIGARIADGSPSNLFKGLIDEAKIAGRIYSQSEIKSDYDHMTTEFDSEAADSEIVIGDQTALGGLATTETEIHSGVASSDTIINDSGSDKVFAYRYAGGDTVSVTVEDGSTLSQFVDFINNDSSNPGVVASILNDGLGSDTSCHLVLTGKDTGKANYIFIDNIATTLDGSGGTVDFGASTFDEIQTAQDAQLTINGYSIQRSSNIITDAIEDVTLNLKSEGSTSITVNWDTTSIKNNIEQLVNSHNSIIDYIKTYTKYDSDTETAGIMNGNYGFLIVQQRLNDIMASSIPGLADGIDTYTVLSQIGIKTDPDNDGVWIIDDETLDQALADDLAAVKRLFIKDTTRTVGGPTKTTADWTGTAQIGAAGTYTGDDDTVFTFTVGGTGTFNLGTDTITINWTSTDDTAPEGSFTISPGDVGIPQSIDEDTGIGKGIYVTLSGSGDTVVGGDTFEIQAFPSGLAGIAELLAQELDKLTDLEDGPLNVLISNYDGINDSIDAKIEREERRIDLVEKRLTKRFADLESLLTKLSSQESYLESLIKKLPTISTGSSK